MTPFTEDPPAPLPERGRAGEEGEEGTEEGHGGTGGQGGRGGRGGIGVTGLTGADGPRGLRGAPGRQGASGGEQGITGKQGEQGLKGDTGSQQSVLVKVAIVAIVLISAFYAIYYAVAAQSRLDNIDNEVKAATAARTELSAEQAVFDTRVKCQQHIEAMNIDAQKARAAFALQANIVQLGLWQAQQSLVSSDLTSPAAFQQALTGYQQALKVAVTSAKDQLRVAHDNPFPTLADVRACQ